MRKDMVSARAALAAGEVERRSRLVFELFKANSFTLLPPGLSKAALYYPVRGEVDTKFFHKEFRRRGVRCLYPKVKIAESGARTRPLEFYEAAEWSELRLGAYGIAEPVPRVDAVSEIPDVILVPGVAFSPEAFRLGYGGGHYDATINEWLTSGDRARLVMIGLAYDAQIVTDLPREPHDHPLDFVVTETRIIGRKKSS